MGKVCTFCGHRNVSENIKTKLQKVLIGLIENDDVDTFLIGQHGNFDKYATGTLKILKKKYKSESVADQKFLARISLASNVNFPILI